MRKALGLTAALVVVALIPVALAQSRRVPSPALEQVNRAILEGRYDEVPALAASLDRQDPLVAVLLARALIARGKYDEALTSLRPLAQRAPTGEAALEYGLLLDVLSKPEAEAVLNRLADVAQRASNPSDLARAARALRALGRPQEANAAYRDAVSMIPRDVATNTAWGDLFLEKFRNGEAVKSYQDALRGDPKYVPALLGMARAISSEDPPQAVTLARQVLELNPSSVPTLVFLAGEALDAGRRDEARQLLTKALEVNPSSLDARALLGALSYIEDKPAEFDAEVARVLALSPRYGEVYRIAAETASHNFRYDDTTALVRRAIALDSQNPRILADLGAHLLRTGDEAEARTALEASFKADNLDPVTYNLLQMLDTLDGFVTVKDGDLIIRMHKDEAPVLTDYAVSLAHQALDTMSKRYQFTPKGPILIEVFPKHDDFAVRTAGLPGLIGALGVCFGRVVTMDSPKARPGTFQWEATLWHELGHVITLQMSNYRVPRWLTEGISVYEEKLHRAEWGRGMEMEFASMLNDGQTLKLRDLNSGFTNPRTISTAYYEASLLVEHIVEVYGDDGLHKLLRAYGTGLDTNAALKSALNTDLDAMQAGFDETLDRMFGKLRIALQTPEKGTDFAKMPPEALKAYAAERPGNFAAQMVLGATLQREGDLDGAMQAFERAAVAVPMETGNDSPRLALAEIAIQQKDSARAIKELLEAMAVDFDNVSLARRLAALMKEQGITDGARLRPVYQRIVQIDPFDADAHAALGRFSMQANQPAAAVREFKAVVALKPIDQASAFTDLAESYLRSGQRADARRQTLAALEVAPSYERAQNLLLEIAERRAVKRRVALLAMLLGLIPVLQPRVDAQLPAPTVGDQRFAGLQWRFVRIKYHYVTEGSPVSQDFLGEPWLIDGPAAEQNLSRRIKTATSIDVLDPIVLTLDDPRLFTYPWIYFVEPGNLKLSDAEAKTFREFLLRGGTALFDDFHGPYEWNHFADEMKKVFPDREIVDIPKDHPVFSCFYKLDGYPQIAGLGSFISGRSWEKGGFVAHLRTIFDGDRPMMFINWNTDMGDGWEWSNAEDYPGYIKYTSMAYRMGINEVVYALTH